MPARARCLSLLALLVTGCAAQMTEEGALVRQITGPAAATGCQFLGVVDAYEGSGWDVGDDRRGAFNRIRNKVAELGGNAFVLAQEPDSTLMGTAVQAEAYRCDTQTPGEAPAKASKAADTPT